MRRKNYQTKREGAETKGEGEKNLYLVVSYLYKNNKLELLKKIKDV